LRAAFAGRFAFGPARALAHVKSAVDGLQKRRASYGSGYIPKCTGPTRYANSEGPLLDILPIPGRRLNPDRPHARRHRRRVGRHHGSKRISKSDGSRVTRGRGRQGAMKSRKRRRSSRQYTVDPRRGRRRVTCADDVRDNATRGRGRAASLVSGKEGRDSSVRRVLSATSVIHRQ